MNVKLPLMDESYTFWFLMGSMVLISGGFIFMFKRKRWM